MKAGTDRVIHSPEGDVAFKITNATCTAERNQHNGQKQTDHKPKVRF